MIPSARRAIASLLFILLAAVCSQSQVAPTKTATISGKITLKTKGLAGVVVAARDTEGPDRVRYRAVTDQNGNYRITNVPGGSYQVLPLAPGLVPENQVQRSLVLQEGDVVKDVNFSLTRGGVITGKITDADGRPVVEEEIFLQAADGPEADVPYLNMGIMTDDRGVYRAFGLRSGKYKVSVGQGESLPGGPPSYPQTFYPSVTEPDKATVVEVSEGSETSNVDITMGRPITSFKVTGQIIDGETGKPLPGIRYGIYQGNSHSVGHSFIRNRSNANGEIKFEGVLPGNYFAFIVAEQNTEVWAEPVPFEVLDRDVKGLVIKTAKAASVSGVVVTEGTEDPAAAAKTGNVYVNAMSTPRPGEVQRGHFAVVGPDGSFRITGLSPGVLHFALSLFNSGGNGSISLERIERDGVIQSGSVNIKDGEQITGLRLIAKFLTATIRGQVKIEDGELPASARFEIWIQRIEEGSTSVRYSDSSPQIDSRGKFLIEGLGGGTYEINIAVYEAERFNRVFKQQVTIADNSANEVTVKIKLNP
jgi:Carboxypeptidase regulatory-like domain